MNIVKVKVLGYCQSTRKRDGRWRVPESSKVNVIAATQGQMEQILEMFEDVETVSHQQSAVTVTQRYHVEGSRFQTV